MGPLTISLSTTVILFIHLILSSFSSALPHLSSQRSPSTPSLDGSSTVHKLYPRPAGPPEAQCRSHQVENITAQHGPFAAAPSLVAGEECAAHSAGCSIASGKMYGVTLTWQAGADLFLNMGPITAGLFGGVSVGNTTTNAITTTVVCPSMCECGIQAVAQMYHVEGTQTTIQTPVGNGPCKKPVVAPYSVDLPVLDQAGSQGNQAVVEFSACRVSNSTCTRDPTLPPCPPIKGAP